MAEEQQGQQRSSVDRVNDLINKAQSVRGNYKKAKGAYNAFKAARTARTAATVVQGAQAVGGATATSPVWGTAAVIILIIILIIILFIIVFAGGQNVKTDPSLDCTAIGGTCGTTCQSPNVLDTSGASCSASLGQNQVCCVPSICQNLNPADPATALRQDWNVVVRGTSNADNLTTIYKIFCSTNSNNYKSLLKTGGNILYIDLVPCFGSICISFTGINNIRLAGFFTGRTYSASQYLLLHESGHVITARNPRVLQGFPLSTLASSDSECYQYNATSCTGTFRSGYFLRSYPLRYICQGVCYSGITASSESFAESLADTVTSSTYNPGYNTFRCAYGLPNFPNQCSNTYSWMRSNILN